MINIESRQQLRTIIGSSRLIEVMVRAIHATTLNKNQEESRQFVEYGFILKELKDADTFSPYEMARLNDMLKLSDALAHGYFFGATKILEHIIKSRDDIEDNRLPKCVRPGFAVSRTVNGRVIEDDEPNRSNPFFVDYLIFLTNGYLELTSQLLNEANSFVSIKLELLLGANNSNK